MVAAKVRRSVFAERLARKYFFSPEVLCSPISQASSPGRCCWPLSLIRCGGPSAIHTRTAAKRAFNRPLVPFRQLTFWPLGVGEHVFGCTRQDVRNVPLAGPPASSNRPDQLDVDRVHLEVTRDADGPGQPACRKPLSKRRTEAVSCIRKYITEAHARCHRAIDLRQGDLWLGSRRLVFDRHAGAL